MTTLVRKNLLHNKLRSSLKLFCVTIAFAIYGVLGGFLEAFQLKGQVDAADRMVVTNRVNFMQPLPLSYVDRVARVQGVEAVTYVRWTLAYHREPKDIIPVVMIPADSYFRVFDKLKIPAADRQNFTQTRNGVVVGRARAKLLGWKIGDRVTLNTMNELTGAYHLANKPDLAVPLLAEMLKLKKAKLGPDHPHTLWSMAGLANNYLALGRHAAGRSPVFAHGE